MYLLLLLATIVIYDTYPDKVKTPGDVLTTDAKVVCVKGYTQTVRNVPNWMKEYIYYSYNIKSHKRGEYEIDHLISLELGGSNDPKNLWPESYWAAEYGAHVKDALENKLHSLVCSGQMELKDAQTAISTDWVAAYKKYVKGN